MSPRSHILGSSVSVRYFSINQTTGELSLAENLDYETNKEHSLTVTALDTTGTASVSVIVLVIDVNDNPPTFNSSKYTGKQNSHKNLIIH